MRLLSWNVNHRVDGQLDGQLAALRDEDPEVLCLLEVTQKSEPQWRSALAGYLPSVVTSLHLREDRTSCNLIASRFEIELLEPDFDVPWREKVLSATVAAPYGPVEVHAVHVPAGTMARREKVLTFRGLYDGLSAPSGAMRVMCGDFNSPQAEHRDGTVEPWGKTEGGVTHAEQMAAELSVLTGLTEHGMRDAFRAVHPHARGQRTVVSPKSRPDAVRRYDHIFVSDNVEVQDCWYRHDWRERRLSDHSAIVAILTSACG